MTDDPTDPRSRLTAYVGCLNERRLDRMAEFYADDLLYNGVPMTRQEWLAQAIHAPLDAIPDFRWEVRDVVAEGPRIAVRYRDTGTVRHAWGGFTPTAGPVSFGEHVFYTCGADGRFVEVWSLADTEVVRRG
jgi:predicted ester cyclase